MLNDNHNIDEQFQRLKRLACEKDSYFKTSLHDDIYAFIGSRKNAEASVRARTKLNEMRKLCEKLRKCILMQRQDNQSEY